MVSNVNSLSWVPLSADNGEWAAVVPLDSATDTVWLIKTLGQVLDTAANIKPNYVIIDNMNNNGLVNVAIGPMPYQVPQYSRKTFKLPNSINHVLITIATGVVNAIFVQSQYAPDDANLLAISQATASPLLFPGKTYAVGTAQVASDQNTYTVFAPVAADISYTLIAAGIAPLQDGWLQFVRNDGTKILSITPAGTDVINGVFTNAAPLKLRTGDSGILQFDGATWHFSGHTHLLAQDVAITAGVLVTAAHGLGIVPTGVQVFLINRTADGNFLPGDKLAIGEYTARYNAGIGDKRPCPSFAMMLDATNLKFITTNGLEAITVTDKTSGNFFDINGTNWKWQIQLDVWQ